jgi:protein ImuA
MTKTKPAQTIAAGRDPAIPNSGESPKASLPALRRRIAEIERHSSVLKTSNEHRTWHLGLTGIDKHLPEQGLSLNAIHEISAGAYAHTPAAMGFALCLALRHPERHHRPRPILWCRLRHGNVEWGNLYGHGLLALGLPPDRMLTVSLRQAKSLLWTVEEALHSKVLSAVIAEVDGRTMDLALSRRLSLAAEAGSTPGLLVYSHRITGATAALSRWQVKARASTPPPFDENAPGAPAWDLVLERCRSGRPGEWSVEWSHATHSFSMVAPLSRGTSQSRLEAGRPLASQRTGSSLRLG